MDAWIDRQTIKSINKLTIRPGWEMWNSRPGRICRRSRRVFCTRSTPCRRWMEFRASRWRGRQRLAPWYRLSPRHWGRPPSSWHLNRTGCGHVLPVARTRTARRDFRTYRERTTATVQRRMCTVRRRPTSSPSTHPPTTHHYRAGRATLAHCASSAEWDAYARTVTLAEIIH